MLVIGGRDMVADKKALKVACSWLADAGVCKYASRDMCDKVWFSRNGCADCLARHFTAMVKTMEENDDNCR